MVVSLKLNAKNQLNLNTSRKTKKKVIGQS